tara:strand:- start:831 stop:1271 length:441 start_codon:yes stop_codon:yes gene_type:complete
MGRIDLAEQLGDARARVSPAAPSAPAAVAGEGKSRTLAPINDTAMYARLTRKETRVREDQYVALTQLARALMRRRASRRERITENTLVRIAIDLLLDNAEQLVGDTESELLHSVTAQRPDSRTSGVPETAAPGVSDDAPSGAVGDT